MSSTSTARVLDSTALERFDPGEELVLTPYPLCDPCGIGFKDEGRTPCDFDPSLADGKLIETANPATKARLLIKKRLYSESAKGQKVLLCSVEQAPTAFEMKNGHARHLSEANLVIVKTFCPTALIGLPGDQYSHDNQFSELKTEATVYQHLYDNNLTGYPHLAPQYYGAWVFPNEDQSENVFARDKYTALIVMEYVDGVSVEELGTRDMSDDCVGPLELSTSPVAVHRDSHKMLQMDVQSRLDLFKILLDGVVRKLHAGVVVDTSHLRPDRTLISFRNNGTELDQPRLVTIGYNHDAVYSLTKPGRSSGEPMPAQQLVRPPHPALYFPNADSVLHFWGWIPEEWSRDNPNQFHDWLVSESGFGPLNDHEKYSNLGASE
ncbi:hypothetical protein CGCVW01_v011133 [Colletotrichum viniferum]|nr:hypothetical protein CGCVW01_v011133 [Colletotrichum viniferum]